MTTDTSLKLSSSILTPSELGFIGYENWRPYQWQTIKRVCESPARLIVLSAPTGSGKSVIGLALAKFAEQRGWSTTVLTKDHALQNQYMAYKFSDGDNPYMAIGRRNFECVHDDVSIGTRADKAPCVIDTHFKRNMNCPFYVQRDGANSAAIRILNYPFYIYERLMGFYQTNLLICDEGHHVDQEILATVKVKLEPWDINILHQFGIELPTPSHTLLSQNHALVDVLRYAMTEIFSAEALGIRDTYKELRRKIAEICDMYNGNCTTIVGSDFSFSPILPEQFSDRLIGKETRKVVLMSATIFDAAYWSQRLGIPDYEFIDLPSTFPREHRPIYYKPAARLSKNSSEADWARVIQAVDITIGKHWPSKGIVHTGSKVRTKMFMDNLKSAKAGYLIAHWDKADLEAFKAADSAVLVSHRATEGLDLPDEMCRFVIFPKMPYPDRGDPIVRAQDAEMPGWYDHTTMTAIIQGCGRGMRHSDDFCSSYIFDGHFAWLRHKIGAGMPQWFDEAILK